MNYKKLLYLITVFLISLLITGCSQKRGTAKKDKLVSVRITPVVTKTISEEIRTTGEVVATNTVMIKATVEGPISYCPWREGDKVKKNEKLIVIDRPVYERRVIVANAKFEVARSILADLEYGPREEEIEKTRELLRHYQNCTRFAKIEYDRTKKLSKKRAISVVEYEKAKVEYIRCKAKWKATENQLKMLEEGTKKTKILIAEANVHKAESEYKLAKAELAECIIRSPFSGIITQVYVHSGDVTSLRSGPRPPLLKLMDADSLIIRSGIPEKSALQIGRNDPVEVLIDSYPGETFKGYVSRIFPRIERNSRTRIVEIRLKDEKVELLPKMFARIKIKGRTYKNALTIPASAIITTPKGYQAAYIIKNGKAKKVRLETGLENGSSVQILKGLNKGDKVVTAGNFNLKNGAEIKVIKTAKNILNQLPQGRD